MCSTQSACAHRLNAHFIRSFQFQTGVLGETMTLFLASLLHFCSGRITEAVQTVV
jgi:hypothetical protein